jgi:hypothetical protein
MMLQLGPIAEVTGFDVESNVPGHLWPPVVVHYELECLEAACMSSNECIVMLLDDAAPKLSVFGDIDLTSEYE